jgi:hypothetical protein
MKPRESNDPKRRIAPRDRLDEPGRAELAMRLSYIGSALHKTKPGDYGFQPPVNPRATKSTCDGGRTVLRAEAQALFRHGIMKGMFSDFLDNSQPKFVWSVDEMGEAYEAKIDSAGYHGYRLEEEDNMRYVVLREWKRR